MAESFPPLHEFWREVFDCAPAAISVITPEGRQLAGNEAYASLFGYTPSEVERLDVDQLTRPEDRPWTDAYLRRLRDGEIDSYTTEKVYVHRDGSTFRAALEVRAVRRDGRLRALIGVISPIVERQPLGQGRLRKLIENIHDTITLLDEHGTVVETTGRYAPILGYPTEFWERRSMFDLVVPDDLALLPKLRDEVLARPGEVVHVGLRVRDASNQVQFIDAHAVNLLHDPDIGGIVVTTRNVTEQRTLVEQLRESRDEAVAEAELRSRMLATVSHELRNPLHALQGISELLAMGELPAPARGLATTLDRQLRDLSRVVDDLLTTSRIELGSVRVEFGDVDLRTLVHDTVAIAAVTAAQGVEVRGAVGEEVPAVVRTDPVRLRQVLANLVGNAVKFTDEGVIEVAARIHDGDLILEVSDTGSGIPEEDHARIFEPLQSSATAGRGAGAGLGLSIVQRIVTLLGGTVALRSEPGVGSTFTVVLPSIPFDTSSAGLTGSAARVADRLVGVHVLVVEDDPVQQKLAEAQLHLMGATSHIVGSGEVGVAVLADPVIHGRAHVDVVLMDRQLPGIQGIDAARRIRAAEASTGRRVPIIGISGAAAPGDRRLSLDAGMDEHLVKPVSLVQLCEAIERLLGRADASTRTSTAVNGPSPSTDVAAEVASALARLTEDLGDKDIAVSVVEAYVDELDRRIDDLVGAAARHAHDDLHRLIHLIGPGSELVGAHRLADDCRSFAHGWLDEAALRRSAAAAAAALRAWVGRSAADAGDQPARP